MKAMILAAGFGTRLWPLTIGRTKPAIPFLNRPLIDYTIDYLARHDIKDLIVNLHHEPESVVDQIGDGSRYGVKITYSLEEPEILGTSGALAYARRFLEDETFIVINGKIITDIDLNLALETHQRQKAIATLVLRRNAGREYFREVIINDDCLIAGFAGFPEPVESSSFTIRNPQSTIRNPLMFTGIQIMEPAIFDYIPPSIFSDSVKDVYPKAIAAGERIAAHVAAGQWYELSTLARYLAISLECSGGDPLKLMGERCIIESGSIVERSILWQGVRIENGAKVRECIVGDGVVIPKGAEFRRAAIVPAAIAANSTRPEKADPGEFVGDNLVVHFG
ncbi:MAG: NDP-sugar synthase [Blastocatellia bacterium]|nr:NDP-sugar synthase [Blastocatellia bacterium]